MGAKEETFYGFMALRYHCDCHQQAFRNRYVGEQIGKGKKLDDILAEMKMVAEGITAVKKAAGFSEKLGLELPLIQGLYDILFEGKDVEEVLSRL